MKSKKCNIIISIFFCALLLLGTVTGLIMPDKYYSESERRTLTRFPKITLESIASGKFGADIEAYLADQFPARDSWITVKTLTELATGKREVGGVYFCKEGYLIEAQSSYNGEQYETNLNALREMAGRLQGEDIPMRVLLVPTASEILYDLLPPFAPRIDQAALIKQAEDMGLAMVNPIGILSEHSDEYIYYKTDHHYTSLGAYYCYSAWKQYKGETPQPLSAWTAELLCDNFCGTSFAKVNAPFLEYDSITAYYKTLYHTVDYNGGNYIANSIYERRYLEGSDQYAVFFNSNQSTTVVSGQGEGRLLILKDSYANCFGQFVIDEYAQTHMIDMRFFKGEVSEYIAQNGITEVLVLYNIPNFIADAGISLLK